MKYPFAITILALMMVTAVTGCNSSWNPFFVAKINVKNSKQLRVGMTKQEVLAIMGEPLRDETFNKPDIWYYYFKMNWGDGLITEDECFPLVFRNGLLIGWGNAYLIRTRLENKDLVPSVDLPQEAVKPRQ